MSKPTLTITKDFTEQFNKTIAKFKNDEVLVGIPESNAVRAQAKDGSPEPITNAAILAINNFGSEPNNIPPWPVLAIGIRRAQKEIANQFAQAAKDALKRGVAALSVYYNRIGIIASVECKKVVNDQDGAPDLSETTLRIRKADGFKGTSRLIVTGQTRNAITYVVKGDK